MTNRPKKMTSAEEGKAAEMIRNVAEKIVEMHRNGESQDEIVDALESNGLEREEGRAFANKVIHAYKINPTQFNKPGFLHTYPSIREVLYFVGSAVFVFVVACLLSLALGLVYGICKWIGLEWLGAILMKIGEPLAGAAVGLMAIGGCKSLY